MQKSQPTAQLNKTCSNFFLHGGIDICKIIFIDNAKVEYV